MAKVVAVMVMVCDVVVAVVVSNVGVASCLNAAGGRNFHC